MADTSKTHGAHSLGEVLMGLVRLPKADKEAKYRPSIDEAKSCGQCRFYLANMNSCTLVEGFIQPGDLCNLFQPAQPIPTESSEPPSEQPPVVEAERAEGWKVVSLKTKQVLGTHKSRKLAERQAAYFKKTQVRITQE